MANGKFLTPDQLADIGLERLRLPIPTVKLHIIHGVAHALDDNTTQAATWAALLRLIATLELESEVLEALCILLVTQNTNMLSIAELRRSIARPSILSDYFVSVAFSTPTLVRAWGSCHSGEAPLLYELDAAELELSEGHIVPSILAGTLRKLEQKTELPFMRQWAYEFERLQATRGLRSQGQLGYFSGEPGQNEVGQFISSRSHMARSAYLRVFALAVDRWDMPEDAALHYAMYSTPADFAFLRMLPSGPLPWSPTALNLTGDSFDACRDVVKEMLSQCENRVDGLLLHYDGPLHHSIRIKADLEIVTVSCCGDINVSQDAFFMHNWLPGHVFIPRDRDNNFHLSPWPADQTFPSQEGTVMRPCLVPAVLNHVGYLHADLILRMPYLPVSHALKHSLVVYPRSGGANITCEDKVIGQLYYWNAKWQPMHHKGVGAHCAVAVMANREIMSTLFADTDCATIRCWRVKVCSRENDYGDWKESVYSGVLE